MSSIAHPNMPEGRGSRRMIRSGRGRALAWLLVPVLLAVAVVGVIVYMRAAASTPLPEATNHPGRAVPADRFMESIVRDDGSLGWHQLCPSVQAQIPQGMLIQQANAQRTAMAQHGLKLSADFVGARPQPSGGELRLYVVTAHWPNGTTEQRTYSVLTQMSGCVEDVKSQ
jgi:hypothetical protein